jgi:hypothetical protein
VDEGNEVWVFVMLETV